MIAAGVVVALAAGAGVVVAVTGDDDKKAEASNSTPGDSPAKAEPPAAPAPKASPSPSAVAPQGGPALAWTIPKDEGDLRHVWVTDAKVYAVHKNNLAIHDAATGAKAGLVTPPPAAGTEICSSVPVPFAGFGLVAWRDKGDKCNQLAGINLATGAIAWTYVVPGTGMMYSTLIAVAGGTAVIGDDQAVTGLDLRTGAPKWTWKTPNSSGPKPHWFVYDLAASEQAVAVGISISHPTDTYRSAFALLDAATGAQKGVHNYADGPDSTVNILSVSPTLVFHTYNDSSGKEAGKVYVYDDQAKPTASLPANTPSAPYVGFRLTLGFGKYVGDAAEFGGTLYAPGKPNATAGQAIEAFDVKSGKKLWSVQPPGTGTVRIVKADAEGVTALVGHEFRNGAQLVRFARADGSATTVHELVADSLFVTDDSTVHIVGKRVVVVTPKKREEIQAFTTG